MGKFVVVGPRIDLQPHARADIGECEPIAARTAPASSDSARAFGLSLRHPGVHQAIPGILYPVLDHRDMAA
ncbi:MAG TPA: hypothetical protein VIK91_25215 [Nannocystis sp.]